ncbi:hypothetical protein PF002_g30660 [Phytophthora fragariae]|uniref:Uncharacterized protein n=1 Tax=Phytophthora fragariae TaxID=53985 RepID=A0A6A3VVD3_9STRA|nr:hypothetical protein PF003_g38912 [Phytophthora fragariae]KAE9066937.1 hypothetical protein PF006_g30102 [Phytophthora fragariae]KAE9124426.1 hypothetical protein PF007_g6714 [Phytophthora fragariae]KAE9168249.1 hypothetical protein PF002_g30660 [Phytophthora fragariae]KAE9264352.1 hypothetical protein PF008_g32140 [Phytophthora fragariae]
MNAGHGHTSSGLCSNELVNGCYGSVGDIPSRTLPMSRVHTNVT